MLNALRRGMERRRLADGLLARLTAQARAPEFYAGLGVADTIDGRFDLLVLHAWLVLDRLADRQGLTQALVDGLFVQFDEALRQQGAGDIGIGRRMTKMADAFYGRLNAYGQAAASEDAMAAAILRNVYRGAEDRVEHARTLAIYALSARQRLARAELGSADIDFGPILPA